MNELYEQIKGIADVSNQAIMSGLKLGRKESEARIKELEARHSALLEDFGKCLNVISELRLEVIRLKNEEDVVL